MGIAMRLGRQKAHDTTERVTRVPAMASRYEFIPGPGGSWQSQHQHSGNQRFMKPGEGHRNRLGIRHGNEDTPRFESNQGMGVGVPSGAAGRRAWRQSRRHSDRISQYQSPAAPFAAEPASGRLRVRPRAAWLAWRRAAWSTRRRAALPGQPKPADRSRLAPPKRCAAGGRRADVAVKATETSAPRFLHPRRRSR
jgi:hypothetical protein